MGTHTDILRRSFTKPFETVPYRSRLPGKNCESGQQLAFSVQRCLGRVRGLRELVDGRRAVVLRGTGPGPGRRVPALCEGAAGGRGPPRPGAQAVQGPSRSGRQAAFNRISAKHVDFVLCVPASLRVVGVVELDDKSHRRLYRGLRDGLVDAALAGAGIPTIRVVARPTYSPVQLRDEVSRAVRPQRAVGRPAKG